MMARHRMSADNTTVLMYHGVASKPDACGLDAVIFDRQIEFLASHFDLVSENGLSSPGNSRRPRVLLTFDDGLRNHATIVAPVLRKYGAPAAFLICHRNTHLQKPLWFSYTKALEKYFPGSELRCCGRVLDMSRPKRRSTIRRLEAFLLDLKPHPSAMYQVIDNELPPLESFVHPDTLADEIYGLTIDQILELAADPLFSIGAHTMDHPILPLCTETEIKRQIDENKEWLESLCKYCIEAIAFPGGYYKSSVIEHCRHSGFRRGYAVGRGFDLDSDLEIPRFGVYRPSLAELGCKVHWSKIISALSRVARLAPA